MLRLVLIPLFLAALSGCGYRVAGKSDLLPASLRTIAIPAFANNTVRYRLTDRLPEAIGREFLSRTRYEIVADPADADATLRGSVVNVFVGDTIFDPTTARAAGARLFVQMRFSLIDNKTGKILYENPGFDFRTRYEVSTVDEGSGRSRDINVYFDESDVALDRLCREVARSVVTSILEAF